jgi:hypothetical protein
MRGTPMKHCTALVALCVLLGACTTIKIGEGDTSSITYEGGPEVANDLASRACRRAGQQSAQIISIENKDASRPPGTGKQVVTFRCSSVGR